MNTIKIMPYVHDKVPIQLVVDLHHVVLYGAGVFSYQPTDLHGRRQRIK